jgi:hypothetical protein
MHTLLNVKKGIPAERGVSPSPLNPLSNKGSLGKVEEPFERGQG